MRVLKEGSYKRTLWDVFVVLLVLASCILIPYQVVFQRHIGGVGSVLLYAVDAFFFIDIWLNVRTSYRRAGVEVTDLRLTRSRYLRTVFPLDLLANVPWELLFLLHPTASIGHTPLLLLLRTLRLFRVVRLMVIFSRWERMGWTNPGYLRIAKFLGLILVISHWLACGWFFTASAGGFPVDSWVVRADLAAASPGVQYTRSLYWTITTMTTVGYGDITPARTAEYFVAMAVMLLGASLYAFIIGNVASLLSNLDSAKAGYWHRMESATEYLRCRQAPRELTARVRSYYEYLWERQRGVGEERVFSDLPEPLQLEVLLHLTRGLLDKVPLFRYASPAMRDVLLMALVPSTFHPGCLVTRAGEMGDNIYFVSSGQLEIVAGDGSVAGVLRSGDYFGDLSLVLGERRTASVRTTEYCEVFVLSGSAFGDIRKAHEEMRGLLKKMSSERSEALAALILEGIVL
jgi:hypothetical protein